MNTNTNNKIKVVHVSVLWSKSGYFQRCLGSKPQHFKSIVDANCFLYKLGMSAGKLGYEKTDFEVAWEDGYVHKGRYDLHNVNGQQENPNGRVDLGDHVKAHYSFCGGTKPTWMEQEKFDACHRFYGLTPEQQQAARDFLETHEL